MEFCEKLIRLRKTHHMTQDDLAQALHVSRQAVYKWECGQSYPEALKLVALKELFGISIDQLLDPTFEVQMPPRTRKRRGTEALEKIKAENGKEAVAQAPVVSDEAEDIPAPAVAEEPSLAEEAPVLPAADVEPGETPLAPVAEPAKKEEKTEKRGFFSRLFGRK